MTVACAPTPRDAILRDGTATLYRFRRTPSAAAEAGPAVLLVPSLINQWYILDLRPGASLVAALVDAGLDVFCIDWGAPRDEDRYLAWDDVLLRLERMARRVTRVTGMQAMGLLGYCMGGTLAAIHAALMPERVAALVNLAGPIDFAHAGRLGRMVDPSFFDAEAVASAGNVHPVQMQGGFVALRPTRQLAKWVGLADIAHDRAKREAFDALEHWASDNIAFPAAAYRTYIEELYQQNLLVEGRHRVTGRTVDLGRIRCPVMTVVADRDEICPPEAAGALNEKVSSAERELLVVRGGHVGAVVGSRAQQTLYPTIARFFLAN